MLFPGTFDTLIYLRTRVSSVKVEYLARLIQYFFLLAFQSKHIV